MECVTENADFIRRLPTCVNLSTRLVPKLRFGNTVVLETLFRLSELVHQNRIFLQLRGAVQKVKKNVISNQAEA